MTSRLLAGVAALAAGAAVAGGHGTETSWFDENYSGYSAVSAVKWTTAAGTWTKESSADLSVCEAAAGKMTLDTRDRELSFAPKAGSSAANSLVKIECQMAFTVCRQLEDWDYSTAKDQQGAIGIREREDGKGLTFFGWKARWFHNNEGLDRSALSSGVWIDLSAPGVVPAEGVVYAVTVENDQSCVPSRIRYSVNGHPLAEASGETWLAAKSSLKPWATGTKRTQKVCFRGRGQVGEIVATAAGDRTARAVVDFARVERPAVGSNLTFTLKSAVGRR